MASLAVVPAVPSRIEPPVWLSRLGDLIDTRGLTRAKPPQTEMFSGADGAAWEADLASGYMRRFPN